MFQNRKIKKFPPVDSSIKHVFLACFARSVLKMLYNLFSGLSFFFMFFCHLFLCFSVIFFPHDGFYFPDLYHSLVSKQFVILLYDDTLSYVKFLRNSQRSYSFQFESNQKPVSLNVEECKFYYIYYIFYYCEQRELPSQYGRPKKRNKIFNIGRRTILYKTFSYSFSILN